MECPDVRAFADSFVAGELLTETNDEILRHLESCPACRADMAARRGLREAVRGAIGRAEDLAPRPEFVAELRTKLRGEAKATAVRRSWRVYGWGALAAGVVIAAGTGLLYQRHSRAATALAEAAVGDHQNCALQFRLTEKPISLDEAARRYGFEYRVLEQSPPDRIATAAGTARVLERHACLYHGRWFGHVVLNYRGQRVSLMVTTADGTGRADSVSTSRIDAMNVVSFAAGRKVVFIAGEPSAGDLTALADSVAGTLRRQLAGPPSSTSGVVTEEPVARTVAGARRVRLESDPAVGG